MKLVSLYIDKWELTLHTVIWVYFVYTNQVLSCTYIPYAFQNYESLMYLIIYVRTYVRTYVVNYVLLCLADIHIRLVGGSSYNEGTVEIYYNGEWGTVCDDEWDDTDAGVVCRQLGFGTYGSSYSLAYFGEGSGPIWLDSVTCIGNESTLALCHHLGVNVKTYCRSHYEDAGVRCYGGTGNYEAIYFQCIRIN